MWKQSKNLHLLRECDATIVKRASQEYETASDKKGRYLKSGGNPDLNFLADLSLNELLQPGNHDQRMRGKIDHDRSSCASV